ncbi:MAG: hypothetical protein D6731_14805 [Planctomycetota bacterium]|nr:MAG: hypothetical protein D6731_14805 [Planctomycetota bacterium]
MTPPAGTKKRRGSRRTGRWAVLACVLSLAGLALVAGQLRRQRDPKALAGRLGEEARILLELGDLEGARLRVERARALERDEPRWTVDLAQVLIRQEDYAGAESLLRAALAEGGGAPSVRVALAKLLLRTERPREARALLAPLVDGEEPIAAWRGRATALRVAGEAAARAGALEDARRLLDRAARDPEPSERVAALVSLSRVCLLLWRFADAEAALRRAEEARPEDVAVALARASLLRARGALVAAERSLRILRTEGPLARRLAAAPLGALLADTGRLAEAGDLARELAAHDALAATHLEVRIALRRGDLAAAQRGGERLTELAPTLPAAHLLRARLALRAADLDAARRSFAEVLRLAPGQAEAAQGLLWLALRRGALDEAEERALGLLEDPRTRPNAVCALLVCARARGGASDALGALSRLTERYPEDRSVRSYALLFRLLGPSPPGEEELAALAADPHLVSDLARLTGAEASGSEVVEAIELLGELVARAPALDSARLVLADIYRGLGRLDLARRTLEGVRGADARRRAGRQLARMALAAGDLAAARRLLAAGQAEHPTDAGDLLLAEVELALGDLDAACARLEALCARQPAEPEFHAARARALLRRGAFAAAEEAFVRAQQLDARRFSAHQGAALPLLAEDWAEARIRLERAWRQTQDPRAAAALGAVLALTGDAPRGLELVDRWRSVAPAAPEGRVAEATLRLACGPGQVLPRPSRAVPLEVFADLRRSTEESAGLSPRRRQELAAFALWVLGLPRLAWRRLARTPPGAPVDAASLWWAARVLRSTGGDLSLRLTLGRQLADRVRSSPWVGLALASLEEAAGEREASLRTLRDLHARFPDRAEVILRLAGRLEAAGEEDEALRLYASLPDEPAALNNRAYLLARRPERRGEALAAARRAVALAPARGELLDTLGWLLHLEGRDAEARGPLERAALLLPTHPQVRAHFGAVLAALGFSERARNNLRTALLLGDFPGRAEAEGLLRRLDGGRGR